MFDILRVIQAFIRKPRGAKQPKRTPRPWQEVQNKYGDVIATQDFLEIAGISESELK